MTTADVLVIGGGVIGASVAYHLLEQNPRLRVILLEREAEVGAGATSKATGGVRHQFSTEANIRLTLLSYPYFTERQFQVALDLMGKSVGQTVDLSYKRFVDHSLLEEMTRSISTAPR